ncbi:MAG: hypothetical protein ACRDSF_12345 [Pseudonocardiaceae bacterium]
MISDNHDSLAAALAGLAVDPPAGLLDRGHRPVGARAGPDRAALCGLHRGGHCLRPNRRRDR